MKLKNILIVVKDIEKSRQFYHDLFGIDLVLDIREQCIRKNVSFEFRQCGTHFVRDGKEYKLQTKDLCAEARKADIDFKRND